MADNPKQSSWPPGDGEMARRVRAHDWAATPLGPIRNWPESLKLATTVVLENAFPAALVWGSGLVTIYNDAFRPILGAKPDGLGRCFAEIWSEVWQEIGPMVERAFAGQSTFIEDHPLVIERSGTPEQTYFTFSYSPVRAADGSVVGMIDTVVETTGKVLAEKALRESEERERFLLKLSDRMRAEGSADAVVAAASQMLGERLGASRIVYAEIDDDAGLARIRQGWTAAGAGIHPAELRLADFGGPLLDSLRAGETVRYDDVGPPPHARADLAALDAIGVKAGLSVPLIVGGRFVVNLNVHQDRPRVWTDAEVELAEAVAERIWAAVQRARAEEATGKSEAEYRRLFDTMDQGFCIIEKVDTPPGARSDFRYVTANAAFGCHTGMRDVVGKTIRDFIPDAEDRIMDRYDEVVRTGQPQRFEDYVSALDLWMEAEAFAGEAPGQVAILFSNISARRRAEGALRDSEARLRALAENLPGGAAFIVDDSLRYVLAGGGALAPAGVSPDDLIGRTIFEALPPELAADYEPRYRSALAGEPFEVEHAAHGRTFISRGAPLTSHNDDGRSVLVVSYDITERKKAEEALRKNEERQVFLLKLSDALRPLASAAEIQAEASRVLGEHLKVPRVAYGEVEGDEVVVRRDYANGIPSLVGRYPRGAFGRRVADAYGRSGTIVLNDASADPELSETEKARFRAAHIAAYAAVVLYKEGKLAVALGAHSDVPRDWTSEEISLIEETAERTWAAVERARVEVALRESEERYRSLFETMGQGYCDLELLRDADGRAVDQRYFELNPAYERLIGIPIADAKGRTASEVMPELEPWWTETFDRIVKGGEPERLEYEVASLGRWFEVFAYPRGGDRLTVLYEDVTERKRAGDALRESEERQAFLLKLSDALRPLADPAAIQATAMRVLGQHLGVTRAQYYEATPDGEHLDSFGGYTDGAPPVTERVRMDDFGTYVKEAFRAGRTLAVGDVAADPRVSEAELASYDALGFRAFVGIPLVKDGRFVAALGIHNATPRAWPDADLALAEETAERTWAAIERARAETALRESDERFRQFGEASSDVLWIRNAETLQWEYLTPAFEAIYGGSREEALEGNDLRRWAERILPEDREHALASMTRVGEGERVTFEYRVRRPTDGQVRWLRDTDFPLFDAAGRVQRIGGIGHDATEEKEFANRLQVLVAELQHRTRNLVAVVRGLSDRTVRESASLDDFRTRFHDRLAAVARVQGLLSRLGEGQRITFDELLHAELTAHGALDGNFDRVTLDGPPGVRLRSGTVQTFALALHELATNAVKYGALSARDGHLAVHWHVEADGAAPELHVEWLESGVAMPEAVTAAQGGGYGRELIERALPYQLKARTTYEMGPDGVRCTIAVPVSETVGREKRDG